MECVGGDVFWGDVFGDSRVSTRPSPHDYPRTTIPTRLSSNVFFKKIN